jgi:hypothetical protein
MSFNTKYFIYFKNSNLFNIFFFLEKNVLYAYCSDFPTGSVGEYLLEVPSVSVGVLWEKMA